MRVVWQRLAESVSELDVEPNFCGVGVIVLN